MAIWFGPDGKKSLKLDEFELFLMQLHEVLEQLEFDMYDTTNSGSITGLDLARSWIAPANVKSIDKLLDRVREESGRDKRGGLPACTVYAAVR